MIAWRPRSTVVLSLAAALLGCGPPEALQGSPRAAFVLVDDAGERAGRAEISTLGAGMLAERSWLDDGAEQRVVLADGSAEVVFLEGRRWRKSVLESEDDRWRQRSRDGLEVETRAFPREAGDVVGVGRGFGALGLGASLASWWRHAPSLLSGDGARAARFVDASSGRAAPLRLEPREALQASVDGREVFATRWFAWTPAWGVHLVVAEGGHLLAVEGLAGGLRAVLEGARVPPPSRAPLPDGVQELPLELEDALGRFHAAITLPEDARGPLPAVLLLPGSGPMDLDGNAGGLRLDLYRRLAGALSARGLLVLRYDKPGISESTEGSSGADLAVPNVDDLLLRARSALHALAARPEADGACLFLVGHSEGGMLAPELALAERERVRGLVLLASPARELFLMLGAQLVAFLRASGASDDEIARARTQQQAALKLLRHGRDVDLPQTTASTSSNAWLKSHLDRSPEQALRALDVPVLAVFGAEDVQVLDETEVAPMKEALAHIGDAEIVVVPGMDHLLMPAGPLPGPGIYVDGARAHASFVREGVPRWISARACD